MNTLLLPLVKKNKKKTVIITIIGSIIIPTMLGDTFYNHQIHTKTSWMAAIRWQYCLI